MVSWLHWALSLWKGNWSLLIGIDVNSRYKFIFLPYRASACTMSDGLRSQWSTNTGSHITLNHMIQEGHFTIKELWQWTYDHRTLWVCDILPFTLCHLIEWWESLWKCSWGTSLEMMPVSMGQHPPGCSMYPKSVISLWCFAPLGRMSVCGGWEVEVRVSLFIVIPRDPLGEPVFPVSTILNFVGLGIMVPRGEMFPLGDTARVILNFRLWCHPVSLGFLFRLRDWKTRGKVTILAKLRDLSCWKEVRCC